jgi:hypothetical protein
MRNWFRAIFGQSAPPAEAGAGDTADLAAFRVPGMT